MPRVEILNITEECFDIALAKIAISRMYLRELLHRLEHELHPLKKSWLEKQAHDQAKKRIAR